MSDTPAPASLPKAIRAKVLDWSDERRLDHGIIVTLSYGWAFYPSEDENAAEHVRSFDTQKEAQKRIQWAAPCKCGRCLKKAGG